MTRTLPAGAGWWLVLVLPAYVALAYALFHYTLAIRRAVNLKRGADEQMGYWRAFVRVYPMFQEYEELYPGGTLARNDRTVIGLLIMVKVVSVGVRMVFHI